MKMATGQDQMSCREEKIFVSVRLRPLNVKERVRNDVADWECINDETVIYRSHLSISDRSMYPTAYKFDRVFGPECCTKQVYDQGAKEVTLSVVSGVHASVFAYGQTSSGKTYTMSGITDYALADIYDYIEKHKEREFILKFSAMEIYNESVRDLLSTDISPLRIRDDPEKGTVVEKLTEETLRNWNHFKELLSICMAQRQIGETALNEVSSRSHQILRLTVESTAREYMANEKFSTLTATVNFVDLAGSERASQSLSTGARLKEGGHINRSLLTLGTVIRKLSKGKTGHIPFRDSKLTRILQTSLTGNARTAIICTMSPARIHVEQSRNTLLFASCAKEVTTNAQVNVIMSDKVLVKHLQRELAKLESELRSPRTLVVSDTTASVKEKDLQIEKVNKEVFQLAQKLERAYSKIEDLQQIVGEAPIKEMLSTDSEQTNVVSSGTSIPQPTGRQKVVSLSTQRKKVNPYGRHLEIDPQMGGSMGLSRSRSCGTSFASSSSFSLFERDANTPPTWYHKEQAESNLKPYNMKRPPTHFSRMSMPTTWFDENLNLAQRMPAALDGVNKGKSPLNESQVFPSKAHVYERQANGKTSSISQAEAEETAPQRDKRIIHLSMEDIEQKLLTLKSSKSFKDAAVDTMPETLTSPLNWQLEFKKLEMEIIELWQSCNVSMAHRSYFFLLFRGDQKDCLHMEVELRRLQYVRETFTHNNKPIENGRTLSSMSSLRALNRERYKLSELMQKKLTKEERENLFLRWGIGLNTKHRRLQLAHRLWSESKDMEHVRESASVVGKLLGFVDMNLASKEMYGLNFSIKPRPKKSSLWKRSVFSLSIL